MQNLNRMWRRTGMALILAAILGPANPVSAAPPLPAGGNEAVFRPPGRQSQLKVVERFSKVIELKTRVLRIDGFDPDVIDVTALTPNQLRVQALSPGVTTLVIVDETNETLLIEVFVAGDVRHLQAYLSHLFPQAAVEAIAVRDSVVLRGWVTQPEHITEMVEIAERFYPRVLNQIRVGGVHQVLLRVRVMEVQRAKIRQLGFNFIHAGRDGFLASTPGTVAPLIGAAAPFAPGAGLGGIAQAVGDSTAAFGVIGDEHAFLGFIEALKRESMLKILAEPELVTTHGRPATLLAGGEFPILVPQNFNVTIQWRQFGVSLEAVPFILGNGRVRLELEPEVSERDFSSAVDVNGMVVPALTTRRVNTQVEMRYGETLMIAGLLSMRQTAQTNKIPFFGELPWMGALFRRVRYDETETELVILVTPELIAPLDPCHLPPGGPGLFTDVPTDRELFKDGMLEVPLYGDRCPPPVAPFVPGPLGAVGPVGPLGPSAPPGDLPPLILPVPEQYPLYQPVPPFLPPDPHLPALPAPMPVPADEGEFETAPAPPQTTAREPKLPGTPPLPPPPPPRPKLIEPKAGLIAP